jgi:hypothetical protein
MRRRLTEDPMWRCHHVAPLNILRQDDSMHKILVALVAAFAVMTASAQIGKAASEATDAAKHKIDEKRADSEARKSGPVGKAVNNVKSGYHKNRSQNSAEKAKKALKDAG